MAALAAFYFDDAGLDLGAWSRDMASVISDRLKNRRVSLPGDSPNDSIQNSAQQFQVVTPSQRPQHGEDGDHMEPQSFPRTGGRKLSRDEVERRLSLALSQTLPQYTVPAKTVAAEIEASPRTVENLRQRVPDAMVTLVMIARAYPQFGSQVARLMALDAEIDPTFQREFAAFVQRVREA